MLRDENAEYPHVGDLLDGEGRVTRTPKTLGGGPGAWNGKSTVAIDEWVQAQLARAPEPGPTQRRMLAAILGLGPEG